MEKVQLILDIVVAILGIIPTVVAGIALIRTIIKNKDWGAVVNIAKDAMSVVEKMSASTQMTGQEKLDAALEIVKKNCIANGITVNDDLISKVIALINELCAWSKTVNVIKK